MIVPLTQERIIRTRRVTANFTEAKRLMIFSHYLHLIIQARAVQVIYTKYTKAIDK